VAWGVTQALTRPDWNAEHVALALQWVRENFTWERVAALTIKAYQQVASAS
jgi:glycosyltransferase involved in cell wall biosynthesis